MARRKWTHEDVFAALAESIEGHCRSKPAVPASMIVPLIGGYPEFKELIYDRGGAIDEEREALVRTIIGELNAALTHRTGMWHYYVSRAEVHGRPGYAAIKLHPCPACRQDVRHVPSIPTSSATTVRCA